MSFKKAVKEQSKLRLALGGLAGAGKTYTALAIAKHLVPGGRVAVIDSERGSASLYADKFSFDVCELETFSPLLYVEKIKEAEDAGYDIIVIDSLSHAWAGKDGALEKKDQIVERGGGNSFNAWAKVTPIQNKLIDTLLGSSCHVIATLRQKQEYAPDVDENGKKVIKKLGLGYVQRDQLDFEFTLVADLDLTHTMQIMKTRIDGIDVGDKFEKPGESFAKKLRDWLNSGAAPTPKAEVVAFVEKMASPDLVAEGVDAAFVSYLSAMESATDTAMLERAATGAGKPAKGTPNHEIATATFRRKRAELTTANGASAS